MTKKTCWSFTVYDIMHDPWHTSPFMLNTLSDNTAHHDNADETQQGPFGNIQCSKWPCLSVPSKSLLLDV